MRSQVLIAVSSYYRLLECNLLYTSLILRDTRQVGCTWSIGPKSVCSASHDALTSLQMLFSVFSGLSTAARAWALSHVLLRHERRRYHNVVSPFCSYDLPSAPHVSTASRGYCYSGSCPMRAGKALKPDLWPYWHAVATDVH